VAQQGVAFSKHGQVKGYFNREFIKAGILSKDIGRFYNKAFEYRQKFDYVDFISPDPAMVAEFVETAANVVARIKLYLTTEQPPSLSS
jgi:uncharacterized protein (UPF0332 family)